MPPEVDFDMPSKHRSKIKTGEDAPDQCQKRPYIDLLPIELLQQVISLGVNDPEIEGPKIKWVCIWRRVCREWKDAIDDCPLLWSSIVITDGTEHVKPQLEKSKGAPLNVRILSFIADLPDRDWIQPLVDNVHRWKSAMFCGYPEEIMERLESPPPMLEAFGIQRTDIPDDCKLFNLVRPNLQKLSLSSVTISHSFNPPPGLEELHLHCVRELRKEGYRGALSVSKVHQFLRGSPNLRVLQIEGPRGRSPTCYELQPVNLPKLEKVSTITSQVLHLFYAENCLDVSLGMRFIEKRPPLSSWATFARALRRVERLMIVVEDGSLNFEAVAGPYEVALSLRHIQAISEDSGSLVFTILQDILDEAETDGSITARVELGLFTANRSESGFDVDLEVLKLLQTPISDASSGQARWRIPNLDTLSILDPGLPSEALKTFVQTRTNGYCMEAASPIMGIFPRSSSSSGEGYYGNVLDEIMAHPARGNDGV